MRSHEDEGEEAEEGGDRQSRGGCEGCGYEGSEGAVAAHQRGAARVHAITHWQSGPLQKDTGRLQQLCEDTQGAPRTEPHRLYLLQSYDKAEFEALTAKYEKLNWRMISKPGGATVKPDDFYQLYGCAHCSRLLRLTLRYMSATRAWCRHCAMLVSTPLPHIACRAMMGFQP